MVVELWKGQHREMDTGNMKSSFRGTFRDEPGFARRYVWSANCTDDIKEMMLNVVRRFAPNLLPTKSFYSEFVFTPKGIQFLGVSYDRYWTEIREPAKPITGD